jgi:hypothetical protein
MMQRTVRFSAIAAITWLLSVAILISVANIALAQKSSAAALACGKELQKQCSGVAVRANNMLECLRRDQKKSPQAVPHWRIVLCSGVREMHCVFVKTLSPVKAMFSDA